MTGTTSRITKGKARQATRDTAALRMLRASAPRAVPRALQAPAPPRVPASQLEPADAAKLAGLRYMNDLDPGIERRASGKAFRYIDANGHGITDTQVLQRIRLLAIPPAWRQVWICPLEGGHIQATGRDARGRKQYIYHPDWVRVRDANKFARMQAFGQALSRIRRRVASDLARPGIPREKVLATVVRLLDTTLIRVGNKAYAKHNRSYGLTTLRTRHVDVSGSEIQFEFRGKSGVPHRVVVSEARLARIVRRLLDLPGQELFRYVDDDGTVRTLDSSAVNEYLHSIAGEDFSAKDFRTWYATLAALQALERCSFDSKTAARKAVTRVLGDVAKRLGNTPAICRKSYVHPIVIDRFLAGTLACDGPRCAVPARRLIRLLSEPDATRSGTQITDGRMPAGRPRLQRKKTSRS